MVALRCISQTALSASQESQLPQVMHGQQNSRLARIPCGSGLARDSSAAVYLPDRVAYIAGKPAPTRAGRERAILVAAFPSGYKFCSTRRNDAGRVSPWLMPSKLW